MNDKSSSEPLQTYRFGGFELDADARELRLGDEALPIQNKVLELLLYLIRARDRAVSKDEIIAAVWPGTVVTDAVLTRAVMKARKALAKDDVASQAIRTVHRHGYRFACPVTVVPCVKPPSAAAPDRSPPQPLEAAASRPSVVVLPFANLTGDPNQEHFADAIASDIITLLGRYRWLDVIARNTAFGYKARPIEVRELADRLAVGYVVEGTVRKAGNRLRVSVELTDARTGRHLWGEKYDRDIADVFEVQDEITRVLVGRLEPEIGIAERQKVAAIARPDLAAWEAFHLGLLHFYRFTSVDNERARALLDRARSLDPAFGEAHAWWAYSTVLGMVYWDIEPDQALLDAALDASQLALQIDDQNAVFYALKARVQLARCEYDSAITENEIAIRLNPTLAVAYCGLGDSLAYEGRYEDAVSRFEAAIELSPNDPQRWAFMSYCALALLFKRDFESALRWLDTALEVPNCQYWALAHKLVALTYLERATEAASIRRRLLEQQPAFSLRFAQKKLFFLKREDQRSLYLGGLRRADVPAD